MRRFRHLQRIVAKIEADPNAKSYTDAALTAVADEDAEHMGLYTQNEAARVAVERELRVAGHHTHAHPANGHKVNGHGDALHQDAAHHDHHDRDGRRPEIVPPAA